MSVIRFLIFIQESGRKDKLQRAEAIARRPVVASCSQRLKRKGKLQGAEAIARSSVAVSCSQRSHRLY